MSPMDAAPSNQLWHKILRRDVAELRLPARTLKKSHENVGNVQRKLRLVAAEI
jgi:hypothetical protein